MNVTLQTGDPLTIEAGALILPIAATNGELTLSGPAAKADEALGGELARLAADARFTAKTGSALLVQTLGRLPARRVVLAGVGAVDTLSAEAIRRAWGAATTAARDAGATAIVSALPPAGGDSTARGRSPPRPRERGSPPTALPPTTARAVTAIPRRARSNR